MVHVQHLLCAFLLFFSVGYAAFTATTTADITGAPWFCGPSSGAMPPLTGVPLATTAGFIHVETKVDSAWYNEYVSFNCEGFNIGDLNAGGPYPDYIYETNVVYGTDCVVETGRVYVPLATMQALTADGVINCVASTGPQVSFCCGGDYAQLVWTYNGVSDPNVIVAVDDTTPAVSQTITVFSRSTDDLMMRSYYYDCDHENGGTGSYLVNSFFLPGTPSYDFTFTCSYPSDGRYCIAVCVDDEGAINCPTLMDSGSACSGKKRNSNLIGVSILARTPLAGDPYFMGFDGKVVKFMGEFNRVYNYISAPSIQINGLIDRGIDNDGDLQMKSVTRQVGLLLPNNQSLIYTCDRHGNTQVTVWKGEEKYAELHGEKFAADSADSVSRIPIPLEGVHLDWTPSANITRRPLHLNPHTATSQLVVKTADYVVEIYSISFVPQNWDSQHIFYFIDLAFTRLHHVEGECLEGVWGRTTCHSSLEEFDMTLYDLNGDLLGQNFPLNLFDQSA